MPAPPATRKSNFEGGNPGGLAARAAPDAQEWKEPGEPSRTVVGQRAPSHADHARVGPAGLVGAAVGRFVGVVADPSPHRVVGPATPGRREHLESGLPRVDSHQRESSRHFTKG